MKKSEAFSGLEKLYDDARPSYPEVILTELNAKLNAVGITTGDVLDIGCGTGIFTRQLVAGVSGDFTFYGYDINQPMISKASERNQQSNASYAVADSTSVPRLDNSAVLMTVAQALQWFDRPAFYAEAQRLLPNTQSIIAVVENNRSWKRSEFLNNYENLLEAHSPGYSRHYRDFDYAAEMTEAGLGAVTTFEHNWSRPMSNEQFKKMSQSSTKMKSAMNSTNNAVLDELNTLVDRYSDNGQLEIPYTTSLIIATR